MDENMILGSILVDKNGNRLEVADEKARAAIEALKNSGTQVKAWLRGTTETVTPAQVIEALNNDRDVAVEVETTEFGKIVFTNFTSVMNGAMIVASETATMYMDGQDNAVTGLVALMGAVNTGEWTHYFTQLATWDYLLEAGRQLESHDAFITELKNDVKTLNEEMVKTINGVGPDENGNVQIAGDGSGVAIDTTLSSEGAAADAKATGDALAAKASTEMRKGKNLFIYDENGRTVGAVQSDGSIYAGGAFAVYYTQSVKLTAGTYMLRLLSAYATISPRRMIYAAIANGAVIAYENKDNINELEIILEQDCELFISLKELHLAMLTAGTELYPFEYGYEHKTIADDVYPGANMGGGNVLYGKHWVACGDSFTAGGYGATDGFDESVYRYQDGRFKGRNIVYPYIIGLRNNMTITNEAVGGSSMTKVDDNAFSVSRYMNIPADADYITLKFGINDSNKAAPVGTIEDSTNETFYGAWNIVLEYLIEHHPFAHIGIIVTNGSNAAYEDAIRAVAKKWGIPYLDEVESDQVPLMHRAERDGVCDRAKALRGAAFVVSATDPVNLHPNTAAHYYESTFIENWLRTL